MPDFTAYISKVAENKISEQEMWESLGQKYKLPKSKVKKLLPIFSRRRIKPQKSILAIAQKLRISGYKVGILSDVIPTHAQIVRAAGVYRGFRPVRLSYKTGISKRKKQAFVLAARAMGLKASEVAFTDDHKYLVAKAKQAGMKAFVYKNAHQLIVSLKRLGVDVKVSG